MSFKETGKTIQSVDLGTLMNWDPCYPCGEILSLTDGRESLSAEEISQLAIPSEDRYWVLVHMLSDYCKHILACEIAESVLAEDSDPRSLAAPAAKRAWLRGEVSDEELEDAYTAAAYFVPYSASASASAYSASAYCAAAYSATRSAAYSAAYSAADSADHSTYSAADSADHSTYYSAYSAVYEKFCQMALNKIKESIDS